MNSDFKEKKDNEVDYNIGDIIKILQVVRRKICQLEAKEDIEDIEKALKKLTDEEKILLYQICKIQGHILKPTREVTRVKETAVPGATYIIHQLFIKECLVCGSELRLVEVDKRDKMLSRKLLKKFKVKE